MGAHAFLCYARHDTSFALAVATGLQERGIQVWVDQWNIEPGADWDFAIDAALNASSSFLIVLSPEAVASREVRGELRAALNTGKRIVPLFYRDCAIPRQLQSIQHVDFRPAGEISQASLDAVAQVLNVATADSHESQRAVSGTQRATERHRTNRRTVLDDVKSEVADRLKRSVSTGTPVPIAMERQPHQVVRRWDTEMRLVAPERPTPRTDRIIEVFDDPGTAGRLLILGAPGSGKTTALLQLAAQLTTRAELDEGEPIPVLLSLASWKRDDPIGDWLVRSLRVKYGIRSDLGVRWRDERTITTLFDGLDELRPEWQEACVEAINHFQQEFWPPHLVVCCRQAEYENFTARLQLRTAVSLLPLDAARIREYIDRAMCPDLWNALDADAESMELARSPLLLSIMSALHDRADVRPWEQADSGAERRRRLFDAYVAFVTRPEPGHREYSPEQMLRWLGRLAATMKREGLSEFLIERMQPGWLGSERQRWSYRAGVLLACAAAVFLLAEAVDFPTRLSPLGRVGTALRANPVFQLRAYDWLVSVVMSIVVGTIIAARDQIVPIERLTWSWSKAWVRMRQWSARAAAAGLVHGSRLGAAGGFIVYVAGFGQQDVVSPWIRAGSICGAAAGGAAAALLASIRFDRWFQYARHPRMTRRVADALTGGVVYVIVLGSTLHWMVALVMGVFASAVIGLTPVSEARFRSVVLKSLGMATAGGAIVGGLTWWLLAFPPGLFVPWMRHWIGGGLAVGMIAGLAIALLEMLTDRVHPLEGSAAAPNRRKWAGPIIATIGVGVGVGLSAGMVGRMGHVASVKGLATFVWYLQAQFSQSLVPAVMFWGTVGLAAAIPAGILGALLGAVSGATGPDVERRAVPNQGIRQSAVNVLVFAGLGLAIIGVPYGLFNLLVGALAMGVQPSQADWLRLGVGAGATFGLMAGLLPGAACIQHFVLRLVLWVNGSAPLRYVRFLNFATERRLLQRVGGRYRFIHLLMQDHLVALEQGGAKGSR